MVISSTPNIIPFKTRGVAILEYDHATEDDDSRKRAERLHDALTQSGYTTQRTQIRALVLRTGICRRTANKWIDGLPCRVYVTKDRPKFHRLDDHLGVTDLWLMLGEGPRLLEDAVPNRAIDVVRVRNRLSWQRLITQWIGKHESPRATQELFDAANEWCRGAGVDLVTNPKATQS